MNYLKIVTSSLLGTSAMTVYSYWRSRRENKNFREPQLLNLMMENLYILPKVPTAAGWILHYKVGIGFAISYHILWKKAVQPSIISGTILGALSGIVGVAVWDTLINKHPNPPVIDRTAFYPHLLVAHVIFGTFAAIGHHVSK
ncbi:MAG TPA: hypothetical protein VK921_07565 [Anditalea sp.]|nr:hypothetical protein [Anditalea sp.]